ncbi:MAG: hypothetical protein V1754_13650, partial [Pseudomonadota bacterium]
MSGKTVTAAQPLEIFVDTDVHVASTAPKKVMDSLRRQLRQYGMGRFPGDISPINFQIDLFQTKGGRHCMP